MNKAFVKEPDTATGRCPLCGSLGIAVGAETLTAFVRPERLDSIAKPAYFCDFARCETVYFDDFDRTLSVADVRVPVWPKDPSAPLCGCFGLTADDVEADVRENEVTRVKALVAKAKSPAACCTLKSPSGQTCVGAVQRYYFRLREQRSS